VGSDYERMAAVWIFGLESKAGSIQSGWRIQASAEDVVAGGRRRLKPARTAHAADEALAAIHETDHGQVVCNGRGATEADLTRWRLQGRTNRWTRLSDAVA
jgi:hypothetical protein